jgi:hypothetical protein
LGLIAGLGLWLIDALSHARSYSNNSSGNRPQPVAGGAAAAAVIPPPGVFDEFENNKK